MSFVSAAQELFNEGFNPLPLNFDKTPSLESGHPFLYDKITDISRRFLYCKKIGIACGPVSDGFYCLDFDKHKGENIEPIFKDFKSDPLVAHLIRSGKVSLAETPSGGYHCYFKYEKVVPGSAISLWEDKTTMIEFRGNGQYIACYPSEGYKYIKGVEFSKLDYLDEDEFDQLMIIVGTFNKGGITEQKTYGNGSGKDWPQSWDNSTVQGRFNNEQGEYAKELLIEAGWRFQRKRRHDGVELWCRPGKEDATSATFGKLNNMFYCFTGSAPPFEQNKAYSPFNIYTILKFNGDWKQAKDSLKPPVELETESEIPHSFFPIEVFPDFIRNYILTLNKTLNFHIDFTAVAAMFTIATLNGNKYKLKVKEGWEASTVFWFACVGYPGTIKTHPVKTMIRPLMEIDMESKRAYDEEMLHYDPDAKPRTAKPKFKQILISDYTIEALHSIHNINKRGIGLYKDELKGFMNDMNKYRKGSDEEFWLESFNNGSYIVNRVTREPIMVNNICINIIGTIQHDVLNKLVNDHHGNGLLDRLLFTASESKVYNLTSDEINPNFAQEWRGLTESVNKYFNYMDSESTVMLNMDKETFATYQAIDAEYVAMQSSEDTNQDVINYLGKMKTYVPRFALLLAIMDAISEEDVIQVTNRHMINAKKVADYFLKTATNVYQANDVQRDIKEMESTMRGFTRHDRIVKLHEKGVKQTELAKYFGVSKQAIFKILKKK